MIGKISFQRNLMRLIICLVGGTMLLITPPQAANSAPNLAGNNLMIYNDGLAGGWENWSWNTTLNLNAGNPTHTGTAAMAATYNQAWAGLYLHHNPPLETKGYEALRFWIHGGSSGSRQINVKLADGSSNIIENPVAVTPQANAWTQITIPLNSWGGLSSLSGILWQEASGNAQPPFYLDEVALAPPGSSNVTLTVNAATVQRFISPDIYGINFASEALARDLRLPVRRWGGNAVTRYNWQNDTSSRASDWFFENISNPNSNPGALPNGSSSDQFVEQDRRTGTKTIITIPLIGWTPKRRLDNHPYDCGFKVSKYGAQQSVDPYDSDCGNGVHSDGTPITNNDPNDTSTATGPAFVQGWVNHLVSRYGSAAQGGVMFYNLDNEPMLWNHTHRDVHPQPTSYDELRDRTYQYAAAIKAADPSAKTLGPVLWGWTAYFYSALDAAPGGSWWTNPKDRNAHDGLPFAEWYLRQMRAYEQAYGVRLLDYLDLHYYPQQTGVMLQPAGDAATQALRLRSTRALWDSTYTDESWINEPVTLIPRMRAWVSNNYPGTKLAITEYNWGGLEHINGALTQADVLGIFGREGLDLATLWAPPEPNQPGAFAFRMYRNYDGAGNGFGDLSVPASSSDQERLSVYAARRSTDSRLTIMVINKTGQNLRTSLTLTGFTPGSQAQIYRYSAARLDGIERLGDQAISNSFSTEFPANSITLYILNPAAGSEIDTNVYLPTILKK